MSIPSNPPPSVDPKWQLVVQQGPCYGQTALHAPSSDDVWRAAPHLPDSLFQWDAPDVTDIYVGRRVVGVHIDG